MKNLVKTIEMIRGKLPKLRRDGLKETPTRTIIVDPLLEALGWDVRDPDEVQLEYPTVDRKSVDYALKLNLKPVLLVEAKALDDPLEDVKAVTQVVGYAANDGIDWCVLTNGVKWKVYRSTEKCPAPEKLMFEVDLDPKRSEGMPLEQLARNLWRISRDEMARGTLDELGEKTFTDGKVRKALNAIMADPPRALLNLVRSAVGDAGLKPGKIKESLMRIWREVAAGGPVGGGVIAAGGQGEGLRGRRSRAATKVWATRRAKAKPGESTHDEAHHISGKPQEVIELYRAVDRLCMSMEPGSISKRYLAHYVSYEYGDSSFCHARVRKDGLRVSLRLKYARLENPPAFARDVSSIGYFGRFGVELALTDLSQLSEAEPLIRQSVESVR